MSKKYDDKGVSKPNYHKGNMNRVDQEAKENLEVVENSTAPDTRYQVAQQIPKVATAEEADPNGSGFVKRKVKTSGSTVKQDVAAKVAAMDADFAGPTAAPGANPNSAGLFTLSYSGDAGTILGTAANTPVVAHSDRNPDHGRFERKLESAARKINYIASEQVIEEYDNPAPLGESGNEVQGYYGTPFNTSARSQKNTGNHPGDPLFQRSADIITRDQLVFVDGQYVIEDGVEYTDEVTVKSTFDAAGNRHEEAYAGEQSGSFLARELQVDITRDDQGRLYISRFDIDSEDITPVENYSITNYSASNYIQSLNKAEIARQMIDEKAGIETLPNYSPLSRGINQPSQVVTALRRIENEVGATVFTAYKFANKAHAYQLNKAAKDGQHATRPVAEMLLGTIAGQLSSTDYSNGGMYAFGRSLDAQHNEDVRNSLLRGSPAIMCLINASASRYNSKADILLGAQSLRQWIQVADNNMNVFRLNPDFVSALNNVDVFSTIDRDYDPLLPICVTDRVGLVYSINPGPYASFTRSAYGAEKKYATVEDVGGGPIVYSFTNLASRYTVDVEHPLWTGIEKWIEQNLNKIWNLLSASSSTAGSVTWRIPIMHSTTSFALWDFLVLASTPYITKVRINSMRDVLDFEEKTGPYPFTDLSTIKECNPMNAVNYEITDIDHPLTSRRMIPSAAITWVMPELFWGIRQNTNGGNTDMYVQPWYFSEGQFRPVGASSVKGSSGYNMDDRSGEMLFPIIRSGVRLAMLDDLYSMSERDIRLCLDRMTRPSAGDSLANGSYAVYKYSQACDGIPAISGDITVKDYLATPRELGWFMVAPAYLLRVRDNLKGTAYTTAHPEKLGVQAFALMDDILGCDTSYRCYCYHGGGYNDGHSNFDTAILQPTGININRAQAFAQVWDCNPAVYMAPTGDNDDPTYYGRPAVGFFLSMSQLGTVNAEDGTITLGRENGVFIPFTSGQTTQAGRQYGQQQIITDATYSVVSVAKALWGRIQKLPMVISPWDVCNYNISDHTGSQYDPFDIAYIFGMSGTMASDYNQDIYDRLQQIQSQGFLFTRDPFVEASPVFKDGRRFTM